MDFSTIKSNLERNGFAVSVFGTVQEANEYLNNAIDGKSVGFGGSVTLDEMGVLKLLETHNNVLYRFDNPDGKTPTEVMKESLTADVFLTSANGIAETGEIINIDGNCNRVAGELYGHEKVYIIVGNNKIAPDFDSALWRARNISAPKNAKRLHKNTPCAVNADRCYNCNSPERICKALVVLWRKPTNCPYEVVIIDKPLGY